MQQQPIAFYGYFLTLLLLIALPCRAATSTETTAPTTVAAPITSASEVNPPTDPTQYLLVQHGAKARLEHVPGEQTFTITLQDVSPYVAYFSDRPARKAGTMSIQEFLKFWERKGNKSFKSDPPNASFNAMEIGSTTADDVKNYSIELTNPQYDSQTNTLRYTAKPLPGTEMPESKTLNYITLFIDSVCLQCW